MSFSRKHYKKKQRNKLKIRYYFYTGVNQGTLREFTLYREMYNIERAEIIDNDAINNFRQKTSTAGYCL